MFGFGKKQKSAEEARNRLKLVIYQDRMNTNPKLVEQLKREIMQVIQAYIEIDNTGLDIKISPPSSQSGGEVPALEVNIPIKGWKVR